jgi:hypothetical protein
MTSMAAWDDLRSARTAAAGAPAAGVLLDPLGAPADGAGDPESRSSAFCNSLLGIMEQRDWSFHHIFSFLRLVLRVPWRGWQMRLVDRPEEQLPKLEAR